MKDNFFKFLFKSTINSYSSIFFSDNRIFAVLLMLVTFFDVNAGISGLVSVLCSNLLAYWMGYNENNIKKGYYGFNSLLVGLGLGITYAPGVVFFALLIFAAVLTLFFSIAMEGIIGKYSLPFLTVPFLLAIWMILLATRQFDALGISQRGIYILNELYAAGGIKVVEQYGHIENLNVHKSVAIYFESLGAIFFQNNVIAGIFITLGILIYSRIAFTLSLVGFYSAYLFYLLIGADFSQLSCNYIGFNFILTAIAIGGYFIVPSLASYIWVVMLIPLIVIVTVGTGVIFETFRLSIYSLPFNVIVLLFLYVLKFRVKPVLEIEEVIFQQNSPERNLYSQLNNRKRFRNTFNFPVALPFWGEWSVSQSHDGSITHRGEWKHAWDFVTKDDLNKSCRGSGLHKEDYYCYGKPVIAPADGIIEETVAFIEDNDIGDMNIQNNWGNTVIIKHAPMLYSKICHLKSGSIKFKKGEYVKRGDLIASCGNSGRSPEPHIHFQLQATPSIGSKTVDFPINYYIQKENAGFNLKQFDRPREGELVSNIEKNILLSNAFHFVPGKKTSYLVKDVDLKNEEKVSWEVQSDYYNNSYILCKKTDSKAYFTNDGNLHYFRHFEGDKKSLLFYFFIAMYKVQMGFYKGLILRDQHPVYLLNNRFLLFFQDFIAPFHMFITSDYTLTYEYIDCDMTSNRIILKSNAETKLANIVRRKINFEIELKNDAIYKIIINEKGKTIEAVYEG